MSETPRRFRVALTGDFFSPDGSTKYPDIGLSVFEGQSHLEWIKFREHKNPIAADQVAGAQGVIVLTPSVTAETVSLNKDLLAVGRFGVGYDAVDVEACTRADVVVFITAGAVDRSVAEATVGWMIALGHHFRTKDILVRTGRWDERSRYMGRELRDRTFGAIGLGGIGRATVALLRGFGMKTPLAFDPHIDARTALAAGARLVPLDELLAESDFVSIHCPLTDQTRGLIGRRELALMKADAYLINTARGGIVDEDELYGALELHLIAGAALDCFAEEPVTRPHRFGQLDNVLLAPHSIAWTDELFRDIGRSVCQGMLDLSLGKLPRGVVNPQVVDRPGFQEKWARLRG
ncbi:MAG: NAD(P)-dependent oxidoreductase [Isosphaerales bacterium]